MTSAPFTARHTGGDCADCGDTLRAGQQIRRVSPDGEYPTWRHAVCPDTPDLDQYALSHPLCPVCGLHHPGAC